jgi:hypothetical protein
MERSLPGLPRAADLSGSRFGNGPARMDDDAPAGERESPSGQPRRKLEIVPGRHLSSLAEA